VVTEMIYIYLSALETDEDRIQFEDIYRKYKNRMYKFAISILHNKEDAEDVIHQAFLIIANSFEKIKPFSWFLIKIKSPSHYRLMINLLK